jgi:hypothetical protein
MVVLSVSRAPRRRLAARALVPVAAFRRGTSVIIPPLTRACTAILHREIRWRWTMAARPRLRGGRWPAPTAAARGARPAPGGNRPAQPARGLKRVGRHSAHPAHSSHMVLGCTHTVWRRIGRGPGGSSKTPEPRVCCSPSRAADQHVPASQAQPLARSHCSTSRCPPRA